LQNSKSFCVIFFNNKKKTVTSAKVKIAASPVKKNHIVLRHVFFFLHKTTPFLQKAKFVSLVPFCKRLRHVIIVATVEMSAPAVMPRRVL
jgi:hypothetical protein